MESADKLKEASEVLADLLRLSGLGGEVVASEDDQRFRLEIRGAESGRVIGRKGVTLDALQYLVTKLVYRDEPAEKPIVVDSEGYRARRDESLVALAQKLADKVKRTGQIAACEPMSAYDRRVMHIAIGEIAGVSSRSEGEGPARHLLVVPEPAE